MKRLLALFLSLTLLFGVTACANQDLQTPSASSNGPVQDASNQGAPDQNSQQQIISHPDPDPAPVTSYPLTLTDQAGRIVTIPAEPQRIVSGYYISTSLLIALRQKDRLVGVEAKAGSRAIYRLSAPELIDLPSVGSAKQFDLEGCAALEPDLVILPLKLKGDAETLEGLNIPVLLVNPESQELLEETVRLVSQATNSQGKARDLARFINTQENWLKEKLNGAERPKVYLAGNSSLLSTAGGKMYQSDLIAQAGGANVAQDVEDTYWVTVSYEQILAWDPEYIILASDAGYTCEDVLSDPNLAACTAVVSGNVFQFPNKAEAWDSPVPSGILGAVWLAGTLHPERISLEECTNIIEIYYNVFYIFSYLEA